MTKITYIPGEIANAAIDEHGNRKPVTRTQHIFDDAKGKSQAEINKEFGNAIGGLNSQNYVTVDSFNALPATGEADTVYRVSNWDGTQQDPTVYSEYAWNGEGYVHLSTKTQIGEVFDISAYHATGGELAKYADLSAALDSNNGGGVPQSLQKGGMSVKFVQSSDNKYVQYRYMLSSTQSGHISNANNWQGVEGKPAFYSKNLVDSNGIAEEFYKKDLNLYRGFLPATIDSSGNWIKTLGFNGCFLVKITDRIKLKVKKGTNTCYFAFLKSDTVNIGQSADFCSGETGRKSATSLTELDIPQDCNYIYCLLSTNGEEDYTPEVFEVDGVSYVDDIDNFKDYIDSLAKSTANMLEQEILQEKTRAEGVESILTTNIGKINTDLEPILDATDNLDWLYKYQFVASDTPSAVLSSNIVLSQDGDSVEFKLDACSYQNFSSDNRGYAFTNNPNSTSKIAFGVTRERMALRADDGTWLIPSSTVLGGSVVGKMVKVSYENSSIKLYIDGVEKASYSGQKTVTISGFGNGSTYGYWDGSFSYMKVNGQSVELKNIATLNKVEAILINPSFLSESEKETLYGVNYPMMIEKTSNKVIVYKKLKNNQYIAYPLNKRYKAYTENQYPSFYDNWGIGQVYLTQFNGTQMTDVTTLFNVGEAELAINVPKSTDPTAYDYVGGSAHGFENIISTNSHRNIIFLIDNQECQEDGVVALKACHSVEVIQKTQLCQAYSNTNPFAETTKQWLFREREDMSISTSVKLLRNIDIKQAQFGMFCVYRHLDGDSNKVYLTNKGVKGNEVFNTYTLEDGWDDLTNHPENTGIRTKDHDCKKITEYGVCGLGFSMAIVDSTTKSSGGMFVTTNGSSYNKIYFDLTGQYSATANEVLSATQEWSIEGKFNQ